MKPRKLTLKTERLAELDSQDLREVAGAGNDALTNPLTECVSFRVCPITDNIRCLIPTNTPACN